MNSCEPNEDFLAHVESTILACHSRQKDFSPSSYRGPGQCANPQTAGLSPKRFRLQPPRGVITVKYKGPYVNNTCPFGRRQSPISAAVFGTNPALNLQFPRADNGLQAATPLQHCALHPHSAAGNDHSGMHEKRDCSRRARLTAGSACSLGAEYARVHTSPFAHGPFNPFNDSQSNQHLSAPAKLLLYAALFSLK